MKPIIRVKNVNFTYNKGNDNEFQALINVSLDIYPEEYVVIFGPSGCGKSTLLNVIAGLETPNNGNIFVFERDLINMNKNDFAMYHKRDVGMIYQAYNLITSLTVLDNVALPQIFVNVGKRRRERWAKTLLERFGILKHAKKIPTELSGGQQQRIGIARAIVNNPQIILADEPIGNLDSISAKNVLDILQNLNEKEKKTIVMVTHNPEYLDYADRIINMKDGLIAGETINRDRNKKEKKKEVTTKPPTDEINDLMRAYHGLSQEKINILIMPYKAKVFTNHFITNRNMEEAKIFEDSIQRRLLGNISMQDFFDILSKSSEEGGVGYNLRTAEKIVKRVDKVIRMAYFIYQKRRQRKNDQGQHDKITDGEKAKALTNYLLKTCYNKYFKNLNEVQINRLQQVIKDRIRGDKHKLDFYKFLDLPFKKGGVGLNSKTARAITEESELIIILGFGIVQRGRLPKIQKFNLDRKREEGNKKGEILASNKVLANDIKKNIIETSNNTSKIDNKATQEVKKDTGQSMKTIANKENRPKDTQKINKDKNNSKGQSEGPTEKTKSLHDAIIAAQEREEKIKQGKEN